MDAVCPPSDVGVSISAAAFAEERTDDVVEDAAGVESVLEIDILGVEPAEPLTSCAALLDAAGGDAVDVELAGDDSIERLTACAAPFAAPLEVEGHDRILPRKPLLAESVVTSSLHIRTDIDADPAADEPDAVDPVPPAPPVPPASVTSMSMMPEASAWVSGYVPLTAVPDDKVEAGPVAEPNLEVVEPAAGEAVVVESLAEPEAEAVHEPVVEVAAELVTINPVADVEVVMTGEVADALFSAELDSLATGVGFVPCSSDAGADDVAVFDETSHDAAHSDGATNVAAALHDAPAGLVAAFMGDSPTGVSEPAIEEPQPVTPADLVLRIMRGLNRLLARQTMVSLVAESREQLVSMGVAKLGAVEISIAGNGVTCEVREQGLQALTPALSRGERGSEAEPAAVADLSAWPTASTLPLLSISASPSHSISASPSHSNSTSSSHASPALPAPATIEPALNSRPVSVWAVHPVVAGLSALVLVALYVHLDLAWRGLPLGTWAAGAVEAASLSDVIGRVLAGNAMIVCWLMLLGAVSRASGARGRELAHSDRNRPALSLSPWASAAACLICLPGALVMATVEAAQATDWGYGAGQLGVWSSALDHVTALAVLVPAMLCVTRWLARIGRRSNPVDAGRASGLVLGVASVALAAWALEQAWSLPGWPAVSLVTWAMVLLLPGVIAAYSLRGLQDDRNSLSGVVRGTVAIAVASAGLGWMVWSLLVQANAWEFWVGLALLLDGLSLALTGRSLVVDLATRRYRLWLNAAIAGFIVGAAWWLTGQGLRGAWGNGSVVEFISAVRQGEPWLAGLQGIPLALVAVRACLLAAGKGGDASELRGGN